jgi:hypothetical protein
MLSVGNKQTKAQHVIGVKLDKSTRSIGKRELSMNNHNHVNAVKEPEIKPHPIQMIQSMPVGLNKSQNKNYNSLEKRR